MVDHRPTMGTINDFIENDFTTRVINNFDIFRFDEINVMLFEYDQLFAACYDPYQNDRDELNNLVNLIKVELNQMNFETIYEMVRITTIFHNQYQPNEHYRYLEQGPDNLIKMYIYWYLYANNYSIRREQLMDYWDRRFDNNNNAGQ